MALGARRNGSSASESLAESSHGSFTQPSFTHGSLRGSDVDSDEDAMQQRNGRKGSLRSSMFGHRIAFWRQDRERGRVKSQELPAKSPCPSTGASHDVSRDASFVQHARRESS